MNEKELESKIVFLVSDKHNNVYLLYFIMTMCFKSTDHHQVISTKLRTRCNSSKNIFVIRDPINLTKFV